MAASARYTLQVVTEFSAAHLLRGYQGSCARLHGHNWRVIVEVWASQLDSIGMAVDFREVRRQAQEVAGELDHRNLNEIPPFDEVNPTAENVAAYFFRRLSRSIPQAAPGRDVRVLAVTIWENERSGVRYCEEDAAGLGALDTPAVSRQSPRP